MFSLLRVYKQQFNLKMEDDMTDFGKFSKLVTANFDTMKTGELFVVQDVDDKIWERYLSSFPEGTNEIFKERTVHDCSCCKHFIRNIGSAVSIKDGVLTTVWDIEGADYPYDVVASALSELVRELSIVSVLRKPHAKFGVVKNTFMVDDTAFTRHHFYGELASRHISKDDSDKAKFESSLQVLSRALSEFKEEAFEIVIDLIEGDGSGSAIYRGEEFLKPVKEFYKILKEYNKPTNKDKNLMLVELSTNPVSRFKNTAIGSLITDLSDGKPIEKAVKSFESKVAPTNYKRPKSVITKRMVESSMKAIEELGFRESLDRRYATIEDVSVNDVIFVDRSSRELMKDSLMDDLMAETAGVEIDDDKATDINVSDFVSNVLPKCESIEALVRNKHSNNFVSVTAPINQESPNIFKWNNRFAWSYNGNITDSMIRDKVQAQGGRVDGAFRFSHSWNYDKRNASLMDLHVFFPASTIKDGNGCNDKYGNNERVGWNNRNHIATGASQDVDYTSAAPIGYIPVENITFPDVSKMPEGDYVCKIHNWRARNPNEGGFKAEIEVGGQIYEYEYDKPLKHKEWVTVAVVNLKDGVFTVHDKIDSTVSSREIWSVNTEKFTKVRTILNSPNHWEGSKEGNKHWFFILDNCKNPEKTRGFYNEYLTNELQEHRKVFEVIGNKTQCQYADNQLSGVGFSSTKRDNLIVKVFGEQNRLYNINF